MSNSSVSIAIAGYGGTGVITTGQLLLAACSKSGLYGLAQRSFGPQIRGGESLSLLRFSNKQVLSLDDSYQLLVLLDTDHVDRFSSEVPLNENSLVVIGKTNAQVPGFVEQSGARVLEIPLDNLAAESAEGGENIVTTGMLAKYLGIAEDVINSQLNSHFANKPELLAQARQWLKTGWRFAEEHGDLLNIGLCISDEAHRPDWLINGSEACGFGALKAGIRFVAAYPITPASGILEWLAPNLEQVGGSLIQAEDELASINMIIGSSFGGVPSLTATSGPGLALMSESIGLAVASETPLVVVDVMRGGPSTGIPTKSEQSDLNIALHGLHGDAPHIVTSFLSIADSAFTTGWSVWLAEQLQAPVIALSDQSLAQSDAIIDMPPLWEQEAKRNEAAPADAPYDRYALTESGISPMAIPGDKNMMYVADGLEHNPHGTPSAASETHRDQLRKRAGKLSSFDYGNHWAEVDGEGASAIICWGSVYSVAKEAADRLTEVGHPCRIIALRLVAPLQVDKILTALEGVETALIVEQSHGAQFMAWLRSHISFTCQIKSLSVPGPLPIRPKQIMDAFTKLPGTEQEIEHVANC